MSAGSGKKRGAKTESAGENEQDKIPVTVRCCILLRIALDCPALASFSLNRRVRSGLAGKPCYVDSFSPLRAQIVTGFLGSGKTTVRRLVGTFLARSA